MYQSLFRIFISLACVAFSIGVDAQEVAEPLWLKGNAEISAEEVEKISGILADFEANVALQGNYFFDCNGWLRNTVAKELRKATEREIRFVGVVDQEKKRVRWICRSEAKSNTGEIVLREYDFIDSGADYDYWINGLKDDRFAEDKERVVKRRALNHEITRFHPVAISTAGMGGVGEYFNRNVVVLQKPDKKYLTGVATEGSKTNVIWHIPSGENYIRKETVFDAKFGNMPVTSRDVMVLVDQGVQFVIQDTATDWHVTDAGGWLPSKLHLTSFRGGEKNPKQVSELIAHMEWFTKIDSEQFALAFELDESDAGRPRWTNQLWELLGEPQRIAIAD